MRDSIPNERVRVYLPIVRRLLATGTGPPGLAAWALRCGVGTLPVPPPDGAEVTARDLARRLAELVAAADAGSTLTAGPV